MLTKITDNFYIDLGCIICFLMMDETTEIYLKDKTEPVYVDQELGAALKEKLDKKDTETAGVFK